MNLRRPLRSSAKVWMAISVPLFLVCWLLPGGNGGDMPMWEIWRVLITHGYICFTGEMLTGVGFLTLIFAVPAAVAGWIFQFPVCAAWDYFHRGKTRDETHVV
jgi:ABC-type Fe3+ transport system permease subunit